MYKIIQVLLLLVVCTTLLLPQEVDAQVICPGMDWGWCDAMTECEWNTDWCVCICAPGVVVLPE